MDKLLHELLRDKASHFRKLVDNGKKLRNLTDSGRVDILEEWADEIERCYIPLPCDTEGKPWKIGDPVKPSNATSDSHVTGYIYDGEEWYLQYRWAGRDNECNELAMNCKRHQDSMERLIGDMYAFASCEGGDMKESLDDFADRLSALIERGA